MDAAWLTRHGYSTALRSQYVAAGWLEQPARRVYRRPRGELGWEQAVVSLQTLMSLPLSVGGRTALDLQGYSHYIARETREVYLHGPERPPTWLGDLPLSVTFTYRNDRRLFGKSWKGAFVHGLENREGPELAAYGLKVIPWGHWEWPLVISTPDRAILELLDELPSRESFHLADKIFEGLSSISPRRMQALLVDCRSVKVKRLFLFFADRHKHAWAKKLDRNAINLGKGKRVLARGGRLDPSYQITVPEDFDGIR